MLITGDNRLIMERNGTAKRCSRLAARHDGRQKLAYSIWHQLQHFGHGR